MRPGLTACALGPSTVSLNTNKSSSSSSSSSSRPVQTGILAKPEHVCVTCLWSGFLPGKETTPLTLQTLTNGILREAASKGVLAQGRRAANMRRQVIALAITATAAQAWVPLPSFPGLTRGFGAAAPMR